MDPRDDALPSHLEMALASIRIFGNDGALDEQELDHLLALALRDGVVDDDEKHVLASVFAQIPREELSPGLRRRIEEVKARYGI